MNKISPEEFAELLTQKQAEVQTKLNKTMKTVCNSVKNTAQKGMTETSVNNGVSYGSKGHHPSLPDNYPAVDTGTLRRSITYEVESGKDWAVGTVGSPLDYGAYLENGTSKMQPRKWLKPSLDKNEETIIRTLKAVLE